MGRVRAPGARPARDLADARDLGRHLLREEGEVVVDVVHRTLDPRLRERTP